MAAILKFIEKRYVNNLDLNVLKKEGNLTIKRNHVRWISIEVVFKVARLKDVIITKL